MADSPLQEVAVPVTRDMLVSELQNLLRLTDIVQEVEGQLTTLRSQATKAARFREISQELKTLRVAIPSRHSGTPRRRDDAPERIAEARLPRRQQMEMRCG